MRLASFKQGKATVERLAAREITKKIFYIDGREIILEHWRAVAEHVQRRDGGEAEAGIHFCVALV
jgi:hypothetical protein